MSEVSYMSNEEVIKALQEIKTYTDKNSIEPLDYAIEIFNRFEKAGIKVPMEFDFSKIAKLEEEK